MDATVKPIGIYLRRVSKADTANTYATIKTIKTETFRL